MKKDSKSKINFRKSDMAEEKKTAEMTGEECSEVSGGIDLGGKGYHVFGPNGERIRYNPVFYSLNIKKPRYPLQSKASEVF